MAVRKLLVTDIRCRMCNAAPGEQCSIVVGLLQPYGLSSPGGGLVYTAHGERIAEHAELERAGWEWQEINPRDDGGGREERTRARGGK